MLSLQEQGSLINLQVTEGPDHHIITARRIFASYSVEVLSGFFLVATRESNYRISYAFQKFFNIGKIYWLCS
jgi:hypothetical protein